MTLVWPLRIYHTSTPRVEQNTCSQCKTIFFGVAMMKIHLQQMNTLYSDDIWGFPKMGVPENHLFRDGFPMRTNQLLGYFDDYGNSHGSAPRCFAVQMKNPDYILNVGDNFYWGGIEIDCGSTPMSQISGTARSWAFRMTFRSVTVDDADLVSRGKISVKWSSDERCSMLTVKGCHLHIYIYCIHIYVNVYM